MRSNVPEIPQGTSKNKSEGEGLFCIVAGLTSSQEDGHWSKCTALPNSGPCPPPLQYPHFFQAICPALSPQRETAPSLQHFPLSPSNLVNLSHLLDVPAPTHHRVQTDPAVKGGNREYWRVPRAPLHIKAPAALCG